MAQRFEGKSLDEALTMATEAFGVSRDQLTYHVVLEKRGFLGGFKRIVVEAEVNDAAVSRPAELSPSAAYGQSSQGAPSRRPGGGGGRGRGGRDRGRGRGGDGRGRGGRSGGDRGRGPRREHGDDFQTGDFERFAGEIPEQGPESEQAGVARAWLARVIELANLQLVIRTEENETQIIVRLFGADARLLTEQHGELLDAIQVLSNKALVGNTVEKEIELNCEAFKERRTEQLAEKARDLADEVRTSGREQLLPAMTPIERRIVHLTLQEDADVTTESRGDGFYKRVAILRRQKQAE
ncbi:MAG TPA: R3H domain-containing nucleic acid-binding protein [Thermoanaerobaculia bacterium]|jgi:predicted RNA-binding protein Jag|nr:R3H domain-containing nucleic acid-binding protein [Thermoanaerobaculia bacterium]